MNAHIPRMGYRPRTPYALDLDVFTMGELSQLLLVSNGNVTAIVRQLQDQGHVALEPAAHDRRSVIVALTPAGAAHFAELSAAHHRWVEAMFAEVPQDAQQALLSQLSAVKASIAAEGG